LSLGIEHSFSDRSTCSAATTLIDIILISVLSFFLFLVLEEVKVATMTSLWSRWLNEPRPAAELEVFRKLQVSHYVRFYIIICSLQWPRVLRRGSSAASLPELRVRISAGAWMSFFCECCVLSGRGPCDGPITRPEESY